MIHWAERHPDWALGFVDETWWDRIFQAQVAQWGEDRLHLVSRSTQDKEAPDRSRAGYGLLLRHPTPDLWIRLADRSPVSALTTPFLAWCLERLAAQGMRALILIWDRAPWHISHAVRRWIAAQNRQVKATGKGVRIIPVVLPSQSPWLNPIEPYWLHAKRRIVHAAGSLSLEDLCARVYQVFDQAPLPLLSVNVS